MRDQRQPNGISHFIFRSILYFDRNFLNGLKRKSVLERGEKFEIELQMALKPLLIEYLGTVHVVRPAKIPPFGYLSAVAVFPDRKLTFVRGRSEFYVTMETKDKERGIFSTSMPSGSGDNGKDGGALKRCVLLLQQHWAELPFASQAEIALFDMQTRELKPMFGLSEP